MDNKEYWKPIKEKLPKLNVPEMLKFRKILAHLIVSIEIRSAEVREAPMPTIGKKWQTNTLRWLKYQRASFVWLDNIIAQQKDYGDGESEF